jgi:hypothetical protein
MQVKVAFPSLSTVRTDSFFVIGTDFIIRAAGSSAMTANAPLMNFLREIVFMMQPPMYDQRILIVHFDTSRLFPACLI